MPLRRVELEDDPADLDVVAGLEPLALERREDAHPLQAPLDVRLRLLVLHVVAGDEPVDGLAGDAELAAAEALDLEVAAGRGAEDGVLGHVVLAGADGGVERLARRHQPQQLALEVVEAEAGRAGGDEDGDVGAEVLAPQLAGGDGVLRRHEVGLGEHEHARQRRQLGAVGGELGLDRRVVVRRVGAVERREVEHVDEHPAALDVGQEVVAETGALRGALDQPGDVGDDQLAVVGLDGAEDRLERRERVVGDLRLGAGEAGDERGLAGVGHADQADVGEELEPQLDGPLLPGQPALGQARRLAGGAGEALVAATAEAALGDPDLLAREQQVDSGRRPSARPPCPAGRARRAARRRRRAVARPGRARRGRPGNGPCA